MTVNSRYRYQIFARGAENLTCFALAARRQIVDDNRHELSSRNGKVSFSRWRDSVQARDKGCGGDNGDEGINLRTRVACSQVETSLGGSRAKQ